MVCGESKLTALVANIALQHAKGIEGSRYARQVLYMQDKLVYCRYATNNNDRHNLSCY